MKTIMITLITLLISALSLAQNTLEIEIKNITESGTLYIGIFDSQEQFDQRKVVKGEVYQATGDEETLEYSFDLPDGTYGIAIYQVTEDTNYSEGNYGVYGFSNEYLPRSYPQFSEFSFELSENRKETITLRSN